MRVGIGYDIHRLVAGRRLVLGGLAIAHPRGLLGHSDGDVLTHAVIDALLGAASLPDIGQHFPDTDPRYENACSLDLLGVVCRELGALGFTIGNVDATIVAQEPKLTPYVGTMRQTLARALAIDEEAVGIKAKTHEGLDGLGRAEAIACFAVAVLEKRRGR